MKSLRIILTFAFVIILLILLLPHLVIAQQPFTFISSTPTPTPFLTNRNPSPEEMEDYLQAVFDTSSLGDDYSFNVENAEWIYEDVSGDGQDDLIISGYLYVVVMVWNENHYTEPIKVHYDPFVRWPASRVYLEDWTFDSVPEIVFDYRFVGGGTGLTIQDWTRNIIRCEANGCKAIWETQLASLVEEANWYVGISLLLPEIELYLDEMGRPKITTHSRAFSVYTINDVFVDEIYDLPQATYMTDPNNPPSVRFKNLRVSAELKREYIWNGDIFEGVHEEKLDEAYVIKDLRSLDALSPSGDKAHITVTRNNCSSCGGNNCKLEINNQAVGDKFFCEENFTQVFWQDITGDAVPEVVILALNGDITDQEEDSRQCINRLLEAYQWLDDGFSRIAHVRGCVVQPDLYGVQLKDIDEDGISEIIAADDLVNTYGWKGNMGYTDLNNKQDRIYRWNGTRFVFSEKVPRE